MSIILNNCKIVMNDKVIPKGSLTINNGKIAKITDQISSSPDAQDINGAILMPGFIDVHIHGAAGADVMDGSTESLDTIARVLLDEGTTSFLATTLTQSPETLKSTCSIIADYASKQDPNSSEKSFIAGIHLEGPFVNIAFKGAQNPNFIQKPNIEAFKEYQSAANGFIKYITFAPELDENFELTKYLCDTGVIASAGHTNATFSDIECAVSNGLSSLTHFHNAMTPHHHRNAGAVTAGFFFDKLHLELICDGIHLSPDVVRTTKKLVPANRLKLITDAMCAKSLADGNYSLGGLSVVKKNNSVRLLDDGTLAGSILKMDDAIQNIAKFTDSTLSDKDLIDFALMSSGNVACHLKLDTKGDIAEGKDADLVILDPQNLKLQRVIKSGAFVK